MHTNFMSCFQEPIHTKSSCMQHAVWYTLKGGASNAYKHNDFWVCYLFLKKKSFLKIV